MEEKDLSKFSVFIVLNKLKFVILPDLDNYNGVYNYGFEVYFIMNLCFKLPAFLEMNQNK